MIVSEVKESESIIDIKDRKVIIKLEKCIQKHFENYLISITKPSLTHKKYPERYGAILSIDYSLSGAYLITTHTKGLIEFRDGMRGEVIRAFQNDHVPVTCARFHPIVEDFAMVSEEKGIIRSMQLVTSREKPDSIFIQENYDVDSIEFSPDGKLLAVGGNSKRIRVYDVETKKMACVFNLDSNIFPKPKDPELFHVSKVSSLRWSAQDPFTFVSGSWDNSIRLWDVREPKGCIMIMQGPNICGDCVDINGNKVIVGSWEATNALTIWDLASGRKLRHVEIINRAHDIQEDFFFTAKFWRSQYNTSGRYVMVGGSGSRHMEAVDIITGQLISCWIHQGTISSFTSRESKIAWAGELPVVSISDFHSPEEFITPDSTEDDNEESECSDELF